MTRQASSEESDADQPCAAQRRFSAGNQDRYGVTSRDTTQSSPRLPVRDLGQDAPARSTTEGSRAAGPVIPPTTSIRAASRPISGSQARRRSITGGHEYSPSVPQQRCLRNEQLTGRQPTTQRAGETRHRTSYTTASGPRAPILRSPPTPPRSADCGRRETRFQQRRDETPRSSSRTLDRFKAAN